MIKEKKIVNSWNEWDPLKHVIVGRADGCCIPAPEPALDAKVPEDSDMKGEYGPRTKETVAKANELLDNFASILEKRDIKVDRPIPINHNQKISTPDWEVKSMFGCMPARDIILTVGNEMLEATMSYRCRWFEYLNYRPLIQKYFNEDKNMRHESAPKPRLTDADYRKDYLSDKIGVQKRLDWTEKKYFVTTEEEPLFDAADILRFGKDLVVQHGFTTNLKGIEWLKRHFTNHRIHPDIKSALLTFQVRIVSRIQKWRNFMSELDVTHAINENSLREDGSWQATRIGTARYGWMAGSSSGAMPMCIS